MKKAISLIMAMTMIFTLTACGKSSSENRLEEIKVRGYITVATEPYFAPNEFYVPTENGEDEIVGADIELAQLIADELGVELKIVPLEFTEVLTSVSEGKYDLAISALAYTPERADAMNLSKGYYTSEDSEGYGMMVRAEDIDKYPNADSFKDAVLVVQKGSLQEALINSQIPRFKEIKYVSSMTDAFLMVKEKKADAAACYIGNGRLYSQANPDVAVANNFKFEDEEELSGTRIGMKKGEDELTAEINSIIDKLVESGQYAQWKDKYSRIAKDLGI